MTSLEYKLEVMNACKAGKEIEFRNQPWHLTTPEPIGRTWKVVTGIPTWNWADYEYRVAPKKPYTAISTKNLILQPDADCKFLIDGELWACVGVTHTYDSASSPLRTLNFYLQKENP